MLKRIFQILLVFITATCFSLTFIVKYHIKSILKEVVRRETEETYKLDLSKISINLTKGRVMVKNANLEPADTLRFKTDYQLKITDLYFTLASWKQLLFHRTLLVDSLRINRANIIIFHSLAHKNTNTALQIGEIYGSLKSISEKFKVRELELSNIGIRIYNRGVSSNPLVISNLNFRLENFGQKKNEESKQC
jgi:hypothetical protein